MSYLEMSIDACIISRKLQAMILNERRSKKIELQ
jgi:hypothetical protein